MDSDYIFDFINAKNICVLVLNNNSRNFTHIYGKMEYFTAMEYFKDFCSRKNIKCYNIETKNSEMRNNEVNAGNKFSKLDVEVSYKYKSSFEIEYIERFNEIEIMGDNYTIDGYNGIKIMKEKLGNLSDYNIIITGINTEKEVLMNTIFSIDECANVGVISDCVSSRSERLHFNSLEIISKFAYVFDTRDMQIIENKLK